MKTQKTRRPRWPVDHQMRSKMPSRGSPEHPNGPQNRPLGPPKPSQDSPGGTLCQSFRIFINFRSPRPRFWEPRGRFWEPQGGFWDSRGINSACTFQYSPKHQVFRLLFDFVNGLASITKSRRTETYVKRVQ